METKRLKKLVTFINDNWSARERELLSAEFTRAEILKAQMQGLIYLDKQLDTFYLENEGKHMAYEVFRKSPHKLTRKERIVIKNVSKMIPEAKELGRRMEESLMLCWFKPHDKSTYGEKPMRLGVSTAYDEAKKLNKRIKELTNAKKELEKEIQEVLSELAG